MKTILRILALIAFVVAAVLSFIVDNPDVLNILGFVSVGLALHEAAHVVPDDV